MFSFIKYLQGLKEKFQRNKGLWFTTITVVSIIGIILTMYLITTMTSNVSEKVYQSMAKEYRLKVTNLLDIKKDEYKKVAIAVLENKLLLEQIEQSKDAEIAAFEKEMNERLIKQSITNYKVAIYTLGGNAAVLRPSIISVIKSKNTIYGIEVMADGVFNTYLQPLIKDDLVYGVIEVKESIHNFKKYFDGIDDEYVFLLDKKMLSQIAIESKNGQYRDMINDYTVAQLFYDTKFTATIPDIKKEEFQSMIHNSYLIDGVYYRTYRIINDINGAEIGIVLLGEYVDKEDGFVNLADNMTKTVTTVALGLVISIMLFMF
ncbi:MAG: hypothetical protein WBG69_11025 [Arcobacteraceae bacterium]